MRVGRAGRGRARRAGGRGSAMKLYYAETLNPRKACAVARYLGAPVAFVRVELRKGESRQPAFLANNPNGHVPVLETAQGTLWESHAAMCRLERSEEHPSEPQSLMRTSYVVFYCKIN